MILDALVVNHSICVSVLLSYLNLTIPVDLYEIAKYFTSIEIADVDVAVVLNTDSSSVHFAVQCFTKV